MHLLIDIPIGESSQSSFGTWTFEPGDHVHVRDADGHWEGQNGIVGTGVGPGGTLEVDIGDGSSLWVTPENLKFAKIYRFLKFRSRILPFGRMILLKKTLLYCEDDRGWTVSRTGSKEPIAVVSTVNKR